MRIVAVVQARLGSTRLPAKVMLDLAGKPALERCLDRVARFRGVHQVIVATSDLAEDDVIARFVHRLGYDVVRGSASDVLERYLSAAHESKADAVVRCTSDCPLLDPVISSEVISAFLPGDVDYASNVLERTLPRGLDTEIVTVGALERAAQTATAAEREHVTLHVYRNAEHFRLRSVRRDGPDRSTMRWTLDTLADYRFLYAVHEELGERASDAGLNDVLAVLERRPEIALLNAHVEQKTA